MMKEKTINDIIQQKEKVFQGKIWLSLVAWGLEVSSE